MCNVLPVMCVLSIAACAHVFYKAGAKVILCARRVDQLQRVKTELQQLKVQVCSGQEDKQTTLRTQTNTCPVELGWLGSDVLSVNLYSGRFEMDNQLLMFSETLNT